jgi:hypothetical protein
MRWEGSQEWSVCIEILKEVAGAYCDGETKENHENRIAHKLTKIPSKLVQAVMFSEWYSTSAWF